jgi:hypothetical protein
MIHHRKPAERNREAFCNSFQSLRDPFVAVELAIAKRECGANRAREERMSIDSRVRKQLTSLEGKLSVERSAE